MADASGSTDLLDLYRFVRFLSEGHSIVQYIPIYLLVLFSLLLTTIYEQYLLSRLDKGKSPFWYLSASSLKILSQIVFLPLYKAFRYGIPFSSVMFISVKNCVKSSES